MTNLNGIMDLLTPQHRRALRWFIEHEGTEQPWTPSIDDILQVTKAKGIYKPNWMEYALSVRQVLRGPYPDHDPIYRSDGTWLYRYFQEGDDPADKDKYYTNRALMACIRDRVPVGVLRQVSGKPAVRYHVLGIARVTDWRDGYFLLEGHKR
jgi:hypothetical protein